MNSFSLWTQQSSAKNIAIDLIMISEIGTLLKKYKMGEFQIDLEHPEDNRFAFYVSRTTYACFPLKI